MRCDGFRSISLILKTFVIFSQNPHIHFDVSPENEMKAKTASEILALVLVAFLGVTFWVSSRGYSSSTFAGSSFHGTSEADRSRVYSEFERFLESEGFRKTSSPSETDSWAGVHGEESQRVWFSRSTGRREQLFLYVDLDMTHIRTSVKWEHRGFNSGADNARTEALRFALLVDDWISRIPEENELPDRFQKKTRQWFEAEIAQINKG